MQMSTGQRQNFAAPEHNMCLRIALPVHLPYHSTGQHHLAAPEQNMCLRIGLPVPAPHLPHHIHMQMSTGQRQYFAAPEHNMCLRIALPAHLPHHSTGQHHLAAPEQNMCLRIGLPVLAPHSPYHTRMLISIYQHHFAPPELEEHHRRPDHLCRRLGLTVLHVLWQHSHLQMLHQHSERGKELWLPPPFLRCTSHHYAPLDQKLQRTSRPLCWRIRIHVPHLPHHTQMQMSLPEHSVVLFCSTWSCQAWSRQCQAWPCQAWFSHRPTCFLRSASGIGGHKPSTRSGVEFSRI